MQQEVLTRRVAPRCTRCDWQAATETDGERFCGNCGTPRAIHPVQEAKSRVDRSTGGSQREWWQAPLTVSLLCAGAFTVIAAVTLVALAIAAARPTDVDTTTLETSIQNKLVRQGGPYLAAMGASYEVDCPAKVESITGNHFSCSVLASSYDGPRYQHYADVYIKNRDGDVSWVVN